ncbi:DUF3987 domain-containing protein [Thermomonospora cellulosilytica]|uniref:DUF3987 domain-containing protein n=1 Tax=Thermomonospora cellulosilytica TaxID=1411118 RepID=A0A7W3R7U1_9ACTN|nr:DUF3987 domain-containing protein [Thermomonospora cellulosilytica]MBA9002700.1 hypothetical protein [Thermomonospora cellulosilytica]
MESRQKESISFLDGAELGRWGADPVLRPDGGEEAFRRWVEAVVAAAPASVLSTVRSDRPAPGWAKVMFLDASPTHETYLDPVYRRTLAPPPPAATVPAAPVATAGTTRPTTPRLPQPSGFQSARDQVPHRLPRSADQQGVPDKTGHSARPAEAQNMAPAGDGEARAAPEDAATGWYKIERPGPLPREAMFSGLLGRVVREIHPYTEGDPVGVLATLLSAFSAAVGHRPHVSIGSSRHPLLIWTMLIGRTSLGRKGTATSAAMDIVERISVDFTERHLLYGSPSSGAGLVGKLEAMAREAGWYDDEPDADSEPELLPGFPALMIEEEWAKVMRRSRIDDALGQNLRTAWQGNTLSVIVKRKSDCATVKDSHLAIVGHITPDEFRANLSAADVAGGTFNRFLPVFVQRCQSLPLADEMPERLADGLAEELRAAVARARRCGRIGLDDEAREYWRDELYDRLTALSTGSELIEAFAGRALPYTRRLAALYALADGRSTISALDLRSAESFIRYVIASVEHIMAAGTFSPPRKARPSAADPHITHKILEALIAAHPSALSRSDLLAKIKNIGSTADLENSLAALGDDLQTTVSRLRGGRPSRLYRLTDAAAARLHRH